MCSVISHGSSPSPRIGMNELHYTLLSEGPTDKALMPMLTWLLQQHVADVPIYGRWADLRRLPRPPRKLHERIQTAVDLYLCDLVFVHRDANGGSRDDRLTEINDARSRACNETRLPPVVPVVPVRMTETWLLLDIAAIREAAGNPHGSVALSLPRRVELENVSDPKRMLHDLILDATELSARRKKRFDLGNAVQRIPEYLEDFSPLRELPAFLALEQQVVETIREQRWSGKSGP